MFGTSSMLRLVTLAVVATVMTRAAKVDVNGIQGTDAGQEYVFVFVATTH
jgi:hypothetical protein